MPVPMETNPNIASDPGFAPAKTPKQSHGLSARALVPMETVDDAPAGPAGPQLPGGNLPPGKPSERMASRNSNDAVQSPQVPGFVHCRRLGPWLRSLYLLQPQLKAAVQELSQTYAELDAWDAVLRHVASCHMLPVPGDHEKWPLCGGDCVVFHVGGNIIKFYCDEVCRRGMSIAWCQISHL